MDKEQYTFWELPLPIKSKLKEELKMKKRDDENDLDNPSLSNEFIGELPTQFPITRCTLCNIGFEDREEQLEHYKSQQHIDNVRNHCLINDEDRSDSSDDENEKDEEEEEDPAKKQFYSYTLSTHTLFFYRRLIETGFYSKDYNPSLLPSFLNCSVAVFLYRSGYFTACIYKNGKCICHKSERRYTTRRKQGGSQSKKDKTTGKARSMGARLRRHNEMLMRECVVSTLNDWSSMLEKCSLIFIGTTKTNLGLFFKDKDSLLHKEDPRIHRVPFTYLRPTLEESYDIYCRLMTVSLISNDILATRRATTNHDISIPIDDQKISEKEGEVTKDDYIDLFSTLGVSVSEEELRSLNIITPKETYIDLNRNMNSETQNKVIIYEEREEREEGEEGEDDEETEETEETEEEEEDIERERVEAKNRVDELYKLLRDHKEEGIKAILQDNLYLLSIWNNDGMTLLHVFTQKDDTWATRLLLEMGSNILDRDIKNKLPYHYASSKTMKMVYIDFRRNYPQRFDYTHSAIPVPVSQEEEEEKKKKKQEKKQLEKQKKQLKKEEEEKKKKEAEEKRQKELEQVKKHPVTLLKDVYKQRNNAIVDPNSKLSPQQQQIQMTRRIYRISSILNLSYHKIMLYLTSQMDSTTKSVIPALTHIEELLDSGEVPSSIIYEMINSM